MLGKLVAINLLFILIFQTDMRPQDTLAACQWLSLRMPSYRYCDAMS